MTSITNQSPDVSEKISIEVKTLNRLIGLLCRSIDILNNAQHREIFLDSLDAYLSESAEMDRFRANLLLSAYYEYVPRNLAELDSVLNEALEFMQEMK